MPPAWEGGACLYEGRVMHQRLGAVGHFFQYPVWYLAADLDALPRLPRLGGLFGYGRSGLLSLRDGDYLEGPGRLREKLDRQLAARGLRAARVVLVTVPRFLRRVFNPVSFYYCYGEGGELLAALAEVNNTFSERHLYLLDAPQASAEGFQAAYSVPKAFHVSPFYDRSGDYEFRFSPLGEALDIRIDIRRGAELAFRSRLWGRARPFGAASLLGLLLRKPFAALLTYPRILWQAAQLRWRKRLPVYTKPYAEDPMTLIPEPAGFWRGLQRDLVLRFFRKLKRGQLTLTLPDRSRLSLGGQEPGPQAELQVGNWSFFRRILLAGDIGFGESYQEGEWTSPEPAAALAFFGANIDVADDRGLATALAGRALNRLKHLGRSNTRRGSRRNIAAHYDLSNELYALFLDETWMYSCALFQDPARAGGEDLAAAQRRKIRSLLEPLQLKPGQKLLEIGSGWGEMAISAARDYGAEVLSITLSREQLQLARQRAAAAGVEGKVRFELRDYRDVQGSFDAAVSCEMLEAVGHDNLPGYFAALERALKPGARAAVQVITLPDERYEAYRRSTDWIQKHIFPGAICPSPGALREAMARAGGLRLEKISDIGPHYVETLRRWRESFLGASARVRDLGFDDKFLRTWDYYFSYCQAGFARGLLGDQQLLLVKPAA